MGQGTMRLIKGVACGILGCAVLLPVAGCGGHSNVQRSGTSIEEDDYAKIEPGKTTAEQARSILGQPNESQVLSDGTEVWTWDYSESVEKSGHFLIVSGSENRKIKMTTSVEVKGGVVVKKMRNRSDNETKSS